MSLGDRYTGMIDHDIVRTLGSVIMVRETRQGSVNHFYVYKRTDTGGCALLFEGNMTECSVFMDNL